MTKDTMTFELEGVGVWRIPMAVATTIEGLADERVAFLARAEAAEAALASCNRARQAAEAECERLRSECVAHEKVQERLIQERNFVEAQLNALETAATPAIANREWMTATEWVLNQIEARLVALEAAGPAVADGRWMAEIERRLDALEQRLDDEACELEEDEAPRYSIGLAMAIKSAERAQSGGGA